MAYQDWANTEYTPLFVTIIHAEESKKPKNRNKIMWKLITNLAINTNKDAVEKLKWYAMRWKIETFHKILKSGCKVEDSKLRTANRLANLIAVFCILSWRIFWMTMINRTDPNVPPKLALTKIEIELLDHLIKDKYKTHSRQKKLSYYLTKIAKLGGYLALATDPPPGNITIWRGLFRLTDIELGFSLALKNCG